MSKTKIPSKELKTSKPITLDKIVEVGFLSKEKSAIISHKAKRKILIGAKQSGKTIIALIDMLVSMDNDELVNNFAMRNAKTGASSQFIGSILGIINQLDMIGLKTSKKFSSSAYNLYRHSVNGIKMDQNQKVQFGSLQNYMEDTSGLGVGNGGYFKTIILDEIIPDTGQFQTQKEWNGMISVIESNFNRFKEQIDFVMESANKDKTPNMSYYYIANLWGDHPLSIEADRYFPENEFIEWVLGIKLEEIFKNEELIDEFFTKEKIKEITKRNTKSVHVVDKDNDIDNLYSRMTVFANPLNRQEQKIKIYINRIKDALKSGDTKALAIYLGTTAEPEIEDNMRVYPDGVIKSIEKYTFNDFIKNGYRPFHITYGIDTDDTRIYTITPSIHFKKEIKGLGIHKLDEKILIDEIIEIKASGAGHLGSNYDYYIKEICEAINRHTMEIRYNLPVAVVVDDKGDWYLREISKYGIHSKSTKQVIFEKAMKHGDFSIKHRQEMVKQAIKSKVIIFHPGNEPLISDMIKCIKADPQKPERKTTSNTNYLDRIDSMEYALQGYINIIWRHIGTN